MKTLITYYSYSGNTDKAVKSFSEMLRKNGEVVTQRLKPKDETNSFLTQCKLAFLRKRAVLEEGLLFDAKPYDLIVIGSPVWAFAPTPAVNTYLDNISGLDGKKAVVLLTSGSGAGVDKCFNNIKSVLESKGASSVDIVNIPDRKLDDGQFVSSSLEKFL